jgi:DNA-directed RNA polymerase specialized sigma24 family protein
MKMEYGENGGNLLRIKEFLKFCSMIYKENGRGPAEHEIEEAGYSDIYHEIFGGDVWKVREALGLASKEQIKILGYTKGVGKLRENMKPEEVLKTIEKILYNFLEYNKQSITVSDREDIVQNAYLKYMNYHKRSFKKKDKNYDTYIKKCLVGCIIQGISNLANFTDAPEGYDWFIELTTKQESPYDIVFKKERRKAIEEMLDCLPSKKCFVLREFLGFNEGDGNDVEIGNKIVNELIMNYGSISDIPEKELKRYGIKLKVKAGRGKKHSSVIELEPPKELTETQKLQHSLKLSRSRIHQLKWSGICHLRWNYRIR